jgi:hypothetical protein
MSLLTPEQLADRAGLSVEQVERMTRLGLLTRTGESGQFRRGDVYRLRLLVACERSGLPLEAVARAVAAGKFSLSFMDSAPGHWPTVGTKTYREVAEGHRNGPKRDATWVHELIAHGCAPAPARISRCGGVPGPALCVDVGDGADPADPLHFRSTSSRAIGVLGSTAAAVMAPALVYLPLPITWTSRTARSGEARSSQASPTGTDGEHDVPGTGGAGEHRRPRTTTARTQPGPAAAGRPRQPRRR